MPKEIKTGIDDSRKIVNPGHCDLQGLVVLGELHGDSR